MMTNDEIDDLAKGLYEYGRLNQTLHPADAIIALGNMDLRLVERAADLWHANLAPVVVASGGVGRLTPKDWTKPEAEIFAEKIYQLGVPSSKVIVEAKSTNAPENIRLSIEALIAAGLAANRLLLVALPFAERRIMAQCKKQFSHVEAEVTSSTLEYSDFCNQGIDRNEMINLIVGEMDRLEKYPAKSFIAPQEIPEHIAEATHRLLAAGFNKYRVKE